MQPTTPEQDVQRRIEGFFAERPELGERFLRFIKTGDEILVDDEMIDFISDRSRESDYGLIVIDLESIEAV